MTSRLANIGYMAMGRESTKGTGVTPSIYLPLYDESLVTMINLDEDNPIVGNKFLRYQNILGQRDHQGEFTVLAEPNTALYLADMLMTYGTPSGAGPYTHPLTISNTTDPKSYTIDVAAGQLVKRFIGAELSDLGISFDQNKMLFKGTVSGLKSFIVREVASVSGSGPYTITLKTNYDPSPTTGLVASDLMTLLKSDGSTINFTVASVASSTTITTSTDVSSLSDGDLIYLRPGTPSLTLREPFMWAKTEVKYGADASTALSATHTPVDSLEWTIKHMFEAPEGAKRSGSFDPAALNRTQADVELTIKEIFDTPEAMNRHLTNQKRSVVIRHFSEGSDYELRLTINNFKLKENPINIKSGEIIYQEKTLVPQYDTSDGQGFDLKVINNISSL